MGTNISIYNIICACADNIIAEFITTTEARYAKCVFCRQSKSMSEAFSRECPSQILAIVYRAYECLFVNKNQRK